MSESNRKWLLAAGRATPTFSGMMAAAATVSSLAAMILVVLIPAVFFLVPFSPRADAVTLCVPGIGPLQQFRDDLEGEREEVVHIHERAHAEQCRWLGAAQYARMNGTPAGRLELEAEAFCAEVEVLSMRGADRERLLDWTEETLLTSYFQDGQLPRSQVRMAVEIACGGGALAD